MIIFVKCWIDTFSNLWIYSGTFPVSKLYFWFRNTNWYSKIIQIIYLRIMYLRISEINFFLFFKWSAMFLDEKQIYFYFFLVYRHVFLFRYACIKILETSTVEYDGSCLSDRWGPWMDGPSPSLCKPQSCRSPFITHSSCIRPDPWFVCSTSALEPGTSNLLGSEKLRK